MSCGGRRTLYERTTIYLSVDGIRITHQPMIGIFRAGHSVDDSCFYNTGAGSVICTDYDCHTVLGKYRFNSVSAIWRTRSNRVSDAGANGKACGFRYTLRMVVSILSEIKMF